MLNISKSVKKKGYVVMRARNIKEKGFTIIEVVLVLAIAALIFLMVFVAFPGLQRSQRDSARRTAVGTVLAAVADYTSNNRGSMPSTAQILPYVTDLTEANYTVTVNATGAATSFLSTAAIDTIEVYTKTQCSKTDSGSVVVASSARQYAVTTLLETGKTSLGGTPETFKDGVPYCQNG